MTNRLFYVASHQDKAEPYVTALRNRGWRPIHQVKKGRFLLMDVDAKAYAVRIKKEWQSRHAPSFVYPHAGPPSLFGDYEGYAPSPLVKARFVAASGHAEVMRAYGYKGKIVIVGWSWCPLRPFAATRLKKILFMPIHPNSNGFLSVRDRKLNKAAFVRIQRIAQECEARLTVRYIHDLADNGLVQVDGVNFKEGRPLVSQALEEIAHADLVIAHHTPAYLAVARGIPTLMIGENETPLIGGREDALCYALHWKEYAHLMAYPLDILDGEDCVTIAREACTSDARISEWRTRMIGMDFNGQAFANHLETSL
jgi:hypothetical protein